MASVQKGYGVKSKTFATIMQQGTRRFFVVLALLAAMNLIQYFTQGVVVYSAFMPYALIPDGVIRMDRTGEIVCYGISVAVILFYALCTVLGKKYLWPIIVGAILHTVDTMIILLIFCYWPEVRESVWIDLMIHVMFMLYWFQGIFFGYRVKKLPDDKPLQKIEDTCYDSAKGNSSILRIADTTVKARVLLEKEVDGQHICYRRVKRVNELVIDRYVYDEIEMLMETPHVLSAQRAGHLIEVGCDNSSHSFIRIDGKEVARKLRIV